MSTVQEESASVSGLPAAFIAPMSHLDLTFMGSVEECLSRGGKVLAAALELLEQQPDFRFLLEYVCFLEAYRSTHPTEAARLDAYIRAGRVELGAQWSGVYVAQEDEEDLIRNVLFATRYARERYGLELTTLQLTDIPGVVPQLPQVCTGLGIQNLVLTRGGPPDALFWYEAPDGSRVLVWSADGYGQAGRYGVHVSTAAMRERALGERLASARSGGVPPLLYYGSDLWLPPPALAENVRAWNAAERSSARLALTTPTGYFRALRETDVPNRAPVLRGEVPSTWLYVEPDHAHVSRWDSAATRALDAAERLSTLAWLALGRPYPRAELDALWRALLLARDHNYGGRGAGSGQPRKLADRRMVQHRARVLASAALAAIAEQVEAPRESVPVVVLNVLNWSRSDVVRAHVSFYPAVDPSQRDILERGSAIVLRDSARRPIPYQITADRRSSMGEFDVAFVAHDVPALGYATYTFEPVRQGEADESPAAEQAASRYVPRRLDQPSFACEAPELVLDNGLLRLAVGRETGQARLFRHEDASRSTPVLVLEGLRLEGRTELPEVRSAPPRALSYDDPAREQVVPVELVGDERVRLVEHGPVLATVALHALVLGVPCEIRYTLAAGLPWVDMEVWLDWDIRRFGRIELAYAVPLAEARATYGLSFGMGSFDADALLPGSGPIRGDEASPASWRRTREICRWLDISAVERGVTMATDHRWTRVDEIDPGRGFAVRCCLVRGGRMRAADPLNDGEDARARLAFRFRFAPHAADWAEARAPRLGWEAVQSFLAYTVNDTWSPKSLPPVQSLATVAPVAGKGDALLTCLKQSEDGDGVVVRWYEGMGHPCHVHVALPRVLQPFNRVDLQERDVPLRPGAPGARGEEVQAAEVGEAATRAWEIVTLRAPIREA